MTTTNTTKRIVDARALAISEAIKFLAGYKYERFGYWAAAYVHYNHLLIGTPDYMKRTPFIHLVNVARALKSKDTESGE